MDNLKNLEEALSTEEIKKVSEFLETYKKNKKPTKICQTQTSSKKHNSPRSTLVKEYQNNMLKTILPNDVENTQTKTMEQMTDEEKIDHRNDLLKKLHNKKKLCNINRTSKQKWLDSAMKAKFKEEAEKKQLDKVTVVKDGVDLDEFII